jgi:uncharacterized protein (TIGR00297 family)
VNIVVFFYQFLFGLCCSVSVAAVAVILQWLSLSGAVAAAVCGTLIIAFGPWYSIFLVGFFFASSGIINHLKKMTSADQLVVKGARRDWSQVFANLAPSLIALIGYAVFDHQSLLWAFMVGIASCTADTWGSEIGVLSKQAPRNILTGKKLPAGLSGGVSSLGTLASFAGSAGITLLVTVCLWLSGQSLQLIPLLVVFLLGFCGSLIDSLLGATIQVRYQCVLCQQYTEQKQHHQRPTKQVHGISWITNEVVNFLSNLAIVVIACVCFTFWLS